MGYFSDLDIQIQEDSMQIDQSPSQDEIEQQPQQLPESEKAVYRFLNWLTNKEKQDE